MPDFSKNEKTTRGEEMTIGYPDSAPKTGGLSFNYHRPTHLRVGKLRAPSANRAIKKIPPELRRRRIHFSAEPVFYKRLLWRWREDSQFQRATVQIAFALLCIWIGIEFYLFVRWGVSAGRAPFFPRPPGVEGFLPISALISFKYWLQTGIINTIHPAGLFIFIAILSAGLLLKKSFCSWLCPIGTLSESLWRLGKKLFGQNLRLAKWLDYPLRTIKYLLLLFFAWAIGEMSVPALKAFICSPYNKTADVKMYLFFADISMVALWTIFILILLSMAIKNFWCRYLCPYGGLLGLLSWLSPLKITRNASTCVDCQLCTKACPATINVHKAQRVWSDECMSCYACVQVCPVKDTLDMQTGSIKKSVPSRVFAGLLVGVFIAITGLAMLFGSWQNDISKEEYLEHFQKIHSPLYQHNRGEVPEYQQRNE